MELFGVGPLEVLLVVLLALVLFGPQDIAKNARSAGRFLNRLYKSEGWRTMTEASSTLRNLPNRLAREAELADLDDLRRDLNGTSRPSEPTAAPAGASDSSVPPAPDLSAWTPRGTAVASQAAPPGEAPAASPKPPAPPVDSDPS